MKGVRMKTNVIQFPMHRVRRTDPVSILAAIAEASFIENLNFLRSIYGLPPLEARR